MLAFNIQWKYRNVDCFLNVDDDFSTSDNTFVNFGPLAPEPVTLKYAKNALPTRALPGPRWRSSQHSPDLTPSLLGTRFSTRAVPLFETITQAVACGCTKRCNRNCSCARKNVAYYVGCRCQGSDTKYSELNTLKHLTAMTPTVIVSCIPSAVYMDTCIEALH